MTTMREVNEFVLADDEADQNDKTILHFGVKGMRWGVRRENRISRLERYASGNASKLDKARVILGEPNSGLAFKKHGRSLVAVSANRAANMRAVDARVAAGRGTVRDILRRHGADKYADLGNIDKDRLAAMPPVNKES